MPTVTKVNGQGKPISAAKVVQTVEPVKNVSNEPLQYAGKRKVYTHKNKGKDTCIREMVVYVVCEDMYCAVCGSPYVLKVRNS